MQATPILIFLMAIVSIGFSEKAPIDDYLGERRVYRLQPAAGDKDDFYSCFIFSNKRINDTAGQTTVSYKLNGTAHHDVYIFTLEKIADDPEDYIAKLYKDVDGVLKLVISFNCEVSAKGNEFAETLTNVAQFRINKMCFSQSANLTEETKERCPDAEGFKSVDFSDC